MMATKKIFTTSSNVLQRHVIIRCRCTYHYQSSINTILWRGSSLRSFGGGGGCASNRDDGCSEAEKNNDGESSKTMYFHISPSGDWWTAPSIFAAKHLQPDYVKSIPIPSGFDPNIYFGEDDDDDDHDDDEVMQHTDMGEAQQKIKNKKLSWGEKERLLYQIYDEGKFPTDLINSIDCSSDE